MEISEKNRTTNICKNLTDAVSFIAAVLAYLIVYSLKKGFEPTDDILFYYQTEKAVCYLNVGKAFLFAAVCGVASRRFAPASLIASSAPVFMTMHFFSVGQLTGRPMVYIIFAFVQLAGAAIYTAQWLGENRNSMGSAFGCGILSLLSATTGALMWHFGEKATIENETALVFPAEGVFALGALTAIFAVPAIVNSFKNEKSKDKKPVRTIITVACAVGFVACVILLIVRIRLTHRIDLNAIKKAVAYG